MFCQPLSFSFFTELVRHMGSYCETKGKPIPLHSNWHSNYTIPVWRSTSTGCWASKVRGCLQIVDGHGHKSIITGSGVFDNCWKISQSISQVP